MNIIAKKQRKYLPTFADLIDRLAIVQLKSIFISSHKDEYDKEINEIIHDLNIIIREKNIKLTGKMVRAILVLMLTNRYIWENETKARAGGNEQDKLLKLTHSINGIRSRAKNVICRELGERVDLKVDSLAADLLSEFDNWDIWREQSKPKKKQKKGK